MEPEVSAWISPSLESSKELAVTDRDELKGSQIDF